jgi:photosystem II stability/assembly factor-like uncharacterized protein
LNRKLRYAFVICSILVLGTILMPLGYSSTGVWRLLNPTELIPGPPVSIVRGVYAVQGGTGSINSGNVWAVGDQGLIFHWNGFSWGNPGPSPSGCVLRSVNFGGPLIPSGSGFSGITTGITSSPGWIVGGTGTGAGGGCTHATALYNDGTGWATYDAGLAGIANLTSVYTVTGSTSVEAWAVAGTGAGVGSFLHWFGTPGGSVAWTTDLYVAPAAVNSVYMTHGFTSGSADDGWAVGDGGRIYRFVGGHWSLFQTMVPAANLHGVALDSTTDGWAVGDGGNIFHFTSGTWNGPVTGIPTTNNLLSITMLSSNEAWVVGVDDASGPTILHGTSLTGTPHWIRIPINQLPSAGALYSVNFAVSGNNVWAGGAGGLLALCASGCSDSSSWGTTTAPLPTIFRSVYMTGDNDGWVVGDPALGEPTLFHWDGTTLTRGTATVPTTDDFLGVWMTSSGEGWAVGGSAGPTPATAHFSGGSWNNVPPPGAGYFLYGIYMSSSSNGWAVGTGGTILHLSSSSGPWGVSSNSGPDRLSNLFAVYFDPGDSNSGWALGYNSTTTKPFIIHTTNAGLDGFPNTIENPGGIPNGIALNSIFMRDNTHIWVVGAGSTILFSGNNGATWTAQLIGNVLNPPLDLLHVMFDSNDDGWAVGTDNAGLPVVVHYQTGSGWSQDTAFTIPPANTANLFGLFLTSSTNGLAVGSGIVGNPATLGLVLHLDPPGLSTGTTSTISTSVTSTSTVITSSTSTVSSSTSSVTSSSTSSTSQASSSQTSSSTSQQSSSSSSSATSSVSTVTASSSSSETTALVAPPIPGFPWESIAAGILVGLSVLIILRRRRSASG